jgi:hypothetical protein
MLETLRLDIGGIVFEVHLPNSDWQAALAERYAAFLSAAEPDWHIELQHDPSLIDVAPGSIELSQTVTRFRIAAYAGLIDLESKQASVSTPSEARAASALERVLSYSCMQMLPREHGAIWLHAVGLVNHGQGYAFFGPSGAGKTTLAQLVRDHAEILTDENVIIASGTNGAQLMSTPIWGQSTPLEIIQRTRRSVPLRAMFALQHATHFKVTRLGDSEAIVALLGTEKVATERVESATAWLGAAGQIVQQVPIYRLEFAPTVEVWKYLEQQQLIV